MSANREVQKRPMTDDEKLAAEYLNRCTFQVASFNKRFARDMASVARSNELMITERQSRTLWKLFFMYRRQIQVDHSGHLRLFDVARPIYEAERKAEERPSFDDLQALKEWNEAK